MTADTGKPEPLVLHDMPTADGDWAVVALPMDTPGETVEQIRGVIRDLELPL
jgi:hypothetical protein